MADNLITVREPETKISGFSYENIVADVYNLIKDNPHLSENFTDYTSADSVRMLTELFAWIADQLSQRLDILGNELFLDTVENKANLLKLLKVIGYELKFPSASSADFEITVENYDDNITNKKMNLSNGVIDEDGSISLKENSFKQFTHVLSGRTFELINFDGEKNLFDYFTVLSIDITKTNNVKLYEGKTASLPFTVNTTGYFSKIINEPVIRNSVRVFYTKPINGEIVELKQVDNFFGPESAYSTVPVYRAINTGNGYCRVIFPSLNDVKEDKLLKLGDEITILYRTGGGKEGNIGKGDLVHKQEIWLDNTRRSYLSIRNTTKGIGGVSEETIDEIRRKAPLDIKNRISAVTASDYEHILKSKDSLIKDIKVYGENNLPEDADIIGTYGYSKNPLDVWLFVVKENENYSNDILEITDYINDIPFQTLDLNERLNEIYQVNKATINVEISTDSSSFIDNSFIDSDIPAYYSMNIPKAFLDEIDLLTVDERENAFIAVTKEPLSEKDNDITGENLLAEYYLKNSYYYKNNVPEYKKSLVIESNGTILPLYEDVIPSLSNKVSGEYSGKIDIKIGETIYPFESENSSVEDIAKELNILMNIYLNNSHPSVVLVDNISNVSGITTLDSGLCSIKIKVGEEEETYSFNITGSESWENLVDSIKGAINTNGETLISTYNVALTYKTYEDADCYILVLFTESENINSFSVTSTTLGLIDEPSRGIIKRDNDEWVADIKDYFFYQNGVLYFENPNYKEIISFSGTLFQTLFGIGQEKLINGAFIFGNKRMVNIENGTLIVGVPNTAEKLPSVLYISGLWGKKNSIILGSYYENIGTDSSSSIPATIRPLLKRNKLKNLYNTAIQEPKKYEINYNPIDIYNSDYEIKATRRKLNDQTYFQVGDNSEYPEISFSTSSINLTSGGELYLKVDGENYSDLGVEKPNGSDVSVAVSYKDGDNEGTIVNYATVEDGYVKFNISSFNGRGVSTLTEAIEKVFSFNKSGITVFSKGSYLGLRSKTNYYYSCLDFSGTDDLVMEYLFKVTKKDEREFFSRDSYIPLEKINYLKYTLKEEEFKENFTVLFKTSSSTLAVETGNSRDAFINNLSLINNPNVVFKDPYIILTDRNNNSYFEIVLEGETKTEVELAKKMFIETENEEVENDSLGYSVTVTKNVVGDYYITNEDGMFVFYPVNFEKFPLGNIYFHMLEDYRYDHIQKEDVVKEFTDQYRWNNIVEDKKMLCVSHVFRQPKFIPFSAKIRLKISKNVSYRKEEVFAQKAYKAIADRYNIYTSVLGESIYQADIRTLLFNIPGILSVDIDYLGYDIQNMATTQNSLSPKFNEKLIASSKKEIEYSITTDSGNTIIEKIPLKGIFIDVGYAQ